MGLEDRCLTAAPNLLDLATGAGDSRLKHLQGGSQEAEKMKKLIYYSAPGKRE